MKKYLSAAMVLFLFLLPMTVSAHHFTDLSKKHWAYHSVHTLADSGILTGYSNGNFKPSQEITRAQAAIVLAKALKIDGNTKFKAKFKDVSTSHYAYKQINALTEKGVFSDAGSFNPEAPLTRAQMAKILIEGFGIQVDSNHLVSFQDVPKSYWGHDYIITIAELGISYGVTRTTFQPGASVTRAQLAAFTERALKFDQRVKDKSITYDANLKLYSGINSAAFDTIAMVNKERAKKGLKMVKEDPALSKIAQLKAEDMVDNRYFAHVSPLYGKPSEMAVHFGYPTNQVGENIALGYASSRETMDAWMESKGHKDNILLPSYTSIGVGYVEDEDGIPYWVHLFAIN